MGYSPWVHKELDATEHVRKKVIRRTRGRGIGNKGEGGARAQARSLSAGHNTLTPTWKLKKQADL